MSESTTETSNTAVDECVSLSSPFDTLKHLDGQFRQLLLRVSQLTAELKQAYGRIRALESSKANVEELLKRHQLQCRQHEKEAAASALALKRSLRQKELELIHAHHQINEMRKHSYRMKYSD
ncbi:uncharacterized protein CANTADRAFT_5718 [Suhomyces tanzawaensis NRRL Y-17324]|uniref:Uncharacterized protein n=1 Tax=Suhomyces tanzawaensis NRRL Y-17324 TaxID=984487 RepID=A0A1E4SKL2_9ASCO|nr:uncharacterized protein CANTADRAFT_5718 [Suhomyces tanzawaensis NRRL Y-17324]ODV80044.1 hypothetical protein CANTADRAFT_5718 [Suhomyces tanzawaensis NRRL Y-17324]